MNSRCIGQFLRIRRGSQSTESAHDLEVGCLAPQSGLEPVVLTAVAARAPLRRNTDPAEVADTAVFLASDLGRGVTGNVVFVDAGFQIMGL